MIVVKYGINCYYKNNKREGKFIQYYDSGKIWYKCYYKNDKIENLLNIMKAVILKEDEL